MSTYYTGYQANGDGLHVSACLAEDQPLRIMFTVEGASTTARYLWRPDVERLIKYLSEVVDTVPTHPELP